MGHVKRMHWTLHGKARTIKIAAKCPDSLWNEFYMTATHLHAKMPTRSLKGKAPFELWPKQVPDYSYMQKIECCAFVMILNQHNSKLNAQGIECMLIEYSQGSKTYRCYDWHTKDLQVLLCTIPWAPRQTPNPNWDWAHTYTKSAKTYHHQWNQEIFSNSSIFYWWQWWQQPTTSSSTTWGGYQYWMRQSWTWTSWCITSQRTANHCTMQIKSNPNSNCQSKS